VESHKQNFCFSIHVRNFFHFHLFSIRASIDFLGTAVLHLLNNPFQKKFYDTRENREKLPSLFPLFLCFAFHKVEFVELEKKIKAEMSLKQWRKVFSSIRRALFLVEYFPTFSLRKKKREQKKYDDESRRLAEKMLQREVYISFQFPPNRRLFVDSARF
jgi:hypothetical protein